jgi:hypothetical protein
MSDSLSVMLEILMTENPSQIETLKMLQKPSQTVDLCSAPGLESRETYWMLQAAVHILVGLGAFDRLHKMSTSKMRPSFV